MTDLVTTEIQNHVADIRLNRPQKMNSLNFEMFEAIAEAGDQLAKNGSVRAVVLSGEGDCFCSGIDLSVFSDPSITNDPFGDGRGGHWPNFFQRPAWVWKTLPVPIIAALHGTVYGGGLQIALGADIRIAHPASRLSVMEIRWGLIPDMGLSQTLRDLVRLDIAKELTFTGREVEGKEAQAIGLVTALSETPRKAALSLASRIANQNPDAIRYGKYLLEKTRHGYHKTGLKLEETLQAKLIGGRNQMEAVRAAMEKRKPVFSDPNLEP